MGTHTTHVLGGEAGNGYGTWLPTLTGSTSEEQEDISGHMREECSNSRETVDEFFGTTRLVGQSKKLGTLSGVFFPCLANIFGVILFLRQPWIVGQSGVIVSEVVVVSSVITTTLTAMSMSAIATNGEVKAGGTYFMISRTLGPEFGGAVGLSFYLATTIAIPMYLLGTVETIREGFGLEDVGLAGLEPQIFGVALSVCCLLIVYIGVQYVSKAIPLFLTATCLGIACMWFGILLQWEDGYDIYSNNKLSENIYPAFDSDYDWRYMFGLFFPSVTGITAGANLSACLKTPSKSIPKGTLWAIAVTSVIYVINIVLFAAAVPQEELKKIDKVIASEVAFPNPLVVQLAIMSSTLGAALACFAGAPRLLQAIVFDDTLPILGFLKEDPDKEPRKTLLVTWIIATGGCLVGDLNFVTPICTMFYLTFYGFANGACFLLVVLRSPNFRPKSAIANAWTAGLGALLCITMMFIINPFVACGTFICSALVYYYITVAGVHHDWGDALFDLRWYTTRKSLLQLDGYGPVHAKNWRPNLMLLTKISVESSTSQSEPVLEETELVRFLSHLRHARGLQVLGTIVRHDYSTGDPPYDVVEVREALTTMCHKKGMKCFIEVAVDTLEHGVSSLLQVAGMGRFQPNIAVVGFPSRWHSQTEIRRFFMRSMRLCEMLHKSLIVFCNAEKYPQTKVTSTIDIWWRPHGGGLLLLIPHLLSLHRDWSKTKLRCFTLVGATIVEPDRILNNVKKLFEELRMFHTEFIMVPFDGVVTTYDYPRRSVRNVLAEAAEQFRTPGAMTQLDTASTIEIIRDDIPSADLDPIEVTRKLNAVIRSHSGSASVIMLNLPKFCVSLSDNDIAVKQYLQSINELTEGLPSTLLIKDGGRDVSTAFS